MRRAVLLAIACTLFAAPTASARVNLGVAGDLDRFAALTGQRSLTGQVFVGWDKRTLDNWFPVLGGMPMFALHTRRQGIEMITPRGIATGRGDAARPLPRRISARRSTRPRVVSRAP